MHKLILLISITATSLVGCGGGNETPNNSNSNIAIEETPVNTNNTLSLLGVAGTEQINISKINGINRLQSAVINNTLANANGSLRHGTSSAVAKGNLTFGVVANDPDGIVNVALYLPAQQRSITLCDESCGLDFLGTITGFNPQLSGAGAGPLRIELVVSDTFDNSTTVDALTMTWQPIQINSINASREDGIVSVNWQGESSLNRYNLYAATETISDTQNIFNLENGTRELAILGNSVQFTDPDINKNIYLSLTGIDGGGESGLSSEVILRASGVNNLPPVAVPDTYSTTEDKSLIGNVIDNDTDANNHTLSIANTINEPTNGRLNIVDDGSFIYTPNTNFFGEDNFTYQLIDFEGATAQTSVKITVEAENDLPNANNDSYLLDITNQLTVSNANGGLLANDSDIDGDTLTVLPTPATPPQFGELTLNSDGSFNYIANGNLTEQDSFRYQVSDGHGGITTAEVILLKNTSEQPPIAINDTYEINEGDTLQVTQSILSNDSDPNNKAILLVSNLVTLPIHGQLNMADDGTFTYIPNSHFFGNDQFQYKIINSDAVTAQAFVNITVKNQQSSPIVLADNYQINEDETLTINVSNGLSANDIDPDNGNLLVNVVPVSTTAKGSLILAADGSFSYTPDTNFNGTDSFSYETKNDSGFSSTGHVTITVKPVIDLPIINNETATINEEQKTRINVLNNDSSDDNSFLTLVSANLTSPENGQVIIVDRELEITPTENFNGTLTINYTVKDSFDNIANGQLTLTVTALNDAPVAQNDLATTDTNVDIDINVLENDTDIDGDLLTVAINSVTIGEAAVDNNLIYFTPSPGFSGISTINYTITDTSGATSNANLTITVNATASINKAPIVNGDHYIIAEDSNYNGKTVLENDLDQDSDQLAVITTPVSNTKHGVLTLFSDGTLNYKPNENYTGDDEFIYQVTDGKGGFAQTNVRLTITPINDNPVAVNHIYNVNEDTTLNITTSDPHLLTNANDVDGDPLTVNTTPINSPTHGQVNLASNGSFTYTANANYFGNDSFKYQITDGKGGTAVATVNLTVKSINDLPVAVNDTVSLNEDTVLTATSVLLNDTDNDGDDLSVSSTPAKNVTHGQLTLFNNGTFVYTPNANFHGVDSFDYTVSDSKGGSQQATVNITVKPLNDVPIANNDVYSLTEDVSFTVTANAINSLLSNDIDIDGDNLSIDTNPIMNVSHGLLTLNADGAFSYIPELNFSGNDSFTYKITDGHNNTATATVALNVANINDNPIAVDDSYTINLGFELSASSLLSNDTDADNDELTLVTTPINGPQSGILQLNTDGSFNYTPSAAGTINFSYQVKDSNGGTDTANVIITVLLTNTAPEGIDDTYQVVSNHVLNASSVLANDTDAELHTLTVNTTPITAPQNGTLTLATNGSFVYIPQANFTGQDSFVYQLNDGNSGVNSATVIINVTDNTVPTAVNDSFDISEDSQLTATSILANDTDVEGDTLSLNTTPISNVNHGILVINVDGTFVYTPHINFNGSDHFTYQINDGKGGSNTATVTINVSPLNDSPVAVNENFNINEDAILTGMNVLTNDTDVDNDTLSVSVPALSPPLNGALNLNSDGNFTYTPTAQFSGNDSFTYQIIDGNGGHAQATVNITIASKNDTPIALADVYFTDEDTPLIISSSAANRLLINDSDIDGDVLTINTAPITNVSHGSLLINSDGSFTYTPNLNFQGVDSFEYEISDGTETARALATITIKGLNDIPIAVDDIYVVDEDQVLNKLFSASDNLLSNDSDPDSDELTLNTQPTTNVIWGTLTLNNNGSFTYTPNADFSGEDSFVYEIKDSQGEIAQATATITVTAINDAPIVNAHTFTISEQETDGFAVGTITANDLDDDNLSYSLSGTHAEHFIISTEGVIVVNGSHPLNFETYPQYNLSVEITDDGTPSESASANITINITDISEALVTKVDNTFGQATQGFIELTGIESQAKLNNVTHKGNQSFFIGEVENIDKDIYLIAYKPNGTIKNGFGSNGSKIIDFGAHEQAKVMVEYNDDFYLAFNQFNGTYHEVCFTKMDTDGNLTSDLGSNNDQSFVCTKEHSDLAINNMVFNGSHFVAVGRKRTTQDDLLIIQMDVNGEFIDHTPADSSDSPHLITDISDQHLNDEGMSLYSPYYNHVLITGNVTTLNGDQDVFAWLIDADGTAITNFNNGDAKLYDIDNNDNSIHAITGQPQANFKAYLGGYTLLDNGQKEAMIIAINETGDLISQFGTAGVKLLDADGDNNDASGYAEIIDLSLSGNQLYAGGHLFNGQQQQFITRILSDNGNIDSSNFGDANGYRKISYGADATFTTAMKVDNNQTAWLTGYSKENDDQKMVISAVNNIGILCNSGCNNDFADGQEIISYTSTASNDHAEAITTFTSGEQQNKYLVVSTASGESQNTIVLSRFTDTGALDNSFDIDGHKQFSLNGSATAKGLLSLPNGNVILYGNVNQNGNTQGFISQLDQNANMVTTFANNGIYNTESHFSSNNATIKEIALDSNNRIIGIGTLDGDSFIFRLTANGQLDGSFSAFFPFYTTPGYDVTTNSITYNSLVIDSNNNVFVAGSRVVSSQKRTFMARYSNTGFADAVYGILGLSVTINMPDSNGDGANKILLDNNEKVILISQVDNALNKAAITKLSVAGRLDTSFSSDGVAFLPLTSSSNAVTVVSAAIDSDNNIIVAGHSNESGTKAGILARISPNGILDSSFDSDGIFTANRCVNDHQFSSLLLNNDTFITAGQCFVDDTLKNDIDIAKYVIAEP